MCLFVSPSIRNQRGDKGVSDSLGSPPLVETMHDSTYQQWQCCMIPRAAGIALQSWKVSNNP